MVEFVVRSARHDEGDFSTEVFRLLTLEMEHEVAQEAEQPSAYVLSAGVLSTRDRPHRGLNAAGLSNCQRPNRTTSAFFG